MYKVRSITANIIEIEDTELSFTKTKVTYHYYNLKNRTVYLNTYGNKVDVNDLTEDKFIPMTVKSFDWAMKYYIPKLGK